MSTLCAVANINPALAILEDNDVTGAYIERADSIFVRGEKAALLIDRDGETGVSRGREEQACADAMQESLPGY